MDNEQHHLISLEEDKADQKCTEWIIERRTIEMKACDFSVGATIASLPEAIKPTALYHQQISWITC